MCSLARLRDLFRVRSRTKYSNNFSIPNPVPSQKIPKACICPKVAPVQGLIKKRTLVWGIMLTSKENPFVAGCQASHAKRKFVVGYTKCDAMRCDLEVEMTRIQAILWVRVPTG